jgi:hypothetical protein
MTARIEYAGSLEHEFTTNVRMTAALELTTGAIDTYILESDTDGVVSWRKPPGWTDDGGGVVRLTNASSTITIGVATAAGTESVRVLNGAVLFDGSTGAVPVSGAGTRLFWAPVKASFRAGIITGTQWDNANVGTNSAAFGLDNIASGAQSVAFGDTNTASGDNSLVIGNDNVVSGDNSLAVGINAILSGNNSLSIGKDTICTYDNAIAHSNGFISTAGDVKTLQLMYYLSGSGNGWTTMTFDGGVDTALNTYILPSNSVIYVECNIAAKATTVTGEAAAIYMFSGLRRDALESTTTSLGTTRTVKEDSANWNGRIQADTTLGGLRIQVRGVIGEDYVAAARVQIVVVTH